MLDKKLRQVSLVNFSVSKCSELLNLQRYVNFLLLRNLASSELFFTILSG
ncbi:riboflavin synthase subunit alpha [Fusobacterium vincentii]|nr:riboflavin synthase subunit alpha [Fusobacterium vincentii]